VVISGCKTGFSEHPDTITKAITRPVNRENIILLFKPASLLYYSDEFYGSAGKYIFTVFQGVLMKTRKPLVAIEKFPARLAARDGAAQIFFPPWINADRDVFRWYR
jgi:hypothetical protein